RHLVGRDPIVLGIPRGGVEVARAVADELDAPLDIVLVRKLPIPFAPETAFGVTSADGITVLDDALVEEVGLDRETIDRV
ncbi:MAG: phosphoribosyltransferase, partial [Actinobacteria bacterium]|nr:phosphoribosyltransferase [Actinomycetota bacterium]NIS31885.1 phosphoribosyltransferase [Actinomycetota bacterium]NIU66963.1 phosphoribosyltransferase [Actinomycetota bacterium]NIV87551.1 phosphoribosyltransferase [Actinomycetota bacterium]NIW28762.1 phosphoribosyltransferase [Actinomycetota bacterium]